MHAEEFLLLIQRTTFSPPFQPLSVTDCKLQKTSPAIQTGRREQQPPALLLYLCWNFSLRKGKRKVKAWKRKKQNHHNNKTEPNQTNKTPNQTKTKPPARTNCHKTAPGWGKWKRYSLFLAPPGGGCPCGGPRASRKGIPGRGGHAVLPCQRGCPGVFLEEGRWEGFESVVSQKGFVQRRGGD